jgi:glutamate transport system substrate-binding protein
MHTRRKWHLLLIGMLVAAATALAACGGDDDEDGTSEETAAAVEAEEFPAGSTMAEIQENGELTIGVKYDVPPFGLNNPESGEVEGFDVDLGNYIGDKLGVEVKTREATSDNRIPLLVDGSIDLILSTRSTSRSRTTWPTATCSCPRDRTSRPSTT